MNDASTLKSGLKVLQTAIGYAAQQTGGELSKSESIRAALEGTDLTGNYFLTEMQEIDNLLIEARNRTGNLNLRLNRAVENRK